MNSRFVQCPKCRTTLLDAGFNQSDLVPCTACGAPLQIEIFPALFRQAGPSSSGEVVMIEGEASCFYHPQKKAVIPCDGCGRFLCALCDCELKGRHFCPTCLQTGQRKQSIQGLEDTRMNYARAALTYAIIPLFITGAAAVYMALRYRKTPGSLVQPMKWAMPVALVLGSLQTLGYIALIVYFIVS